MTVLSRKYVQVFYIVFLSFQFNNGQAQNTSQVIVFGDSLFHQQNYFAAINEYQRAFFFSETGKKSELCLKIADCYLLVNELKMSQNFCDTALYYAQNDSITTECHLHKILGYIYEKNYGYALLKLDELKTDTTIYFDYKKNLYRGISQFGMEKFDEAFQSFNNIFIASDSIKLLQLNHLYAKRKKLLYPHPGVATVMSIFVPGTGQMYSCNYLDGFNSIVLLSGLFLIVIDVPVYSLIFSPFIYRYYIGGILNANDHAKKKKMIKQYYYYNDILEIFQDTKLLRPLFNVKDEPNISYEHLHGTFSEKYNMLYLFFSFYKKYLSSQDVDACVFYPSCSVYTMEAVEKYGKVKGILEGLDRLLRCHSFVNRKDYLYNEVAKKYYNAL